MQSATLTYSLRNASNQRVARERDLELENFHLQGL